MALRLAAACGDLETLCSLHINGANLRAENDEALLLAAAGGHLEIVRYLHQNGVDIRAGNDETFRLAAAHGHLNVLRYLHENGVDLAVQENASLCAAAGNGQLEVVRYFHQNGVDLAAGDNSALLEAAAHGHLQVVKYLHQNGVDICTHKGAALCLAAAGRHGEVVRYLHENGAVTGHLTQEGKDCLSAMKAEIASAPSTYQPSTFWNEVGGGQTRLLTWAGEVNFKRTVNQTFFNFIPTDPEDPRIAYLSHPFPLAAGDPGPESRLESPDCDPGLWTSWIPSYQVFKQDRSQQEELYLRLVRTLYEFVLKHDPEGILQRLEEPLLGNPIRVWRGNKLVSQDLAHSVWERNVILGGLAHGEWAEPLVIAELGAGYGRLAHVLFASAACRYMVFDIPPALYLSQWYLANLFPKKRIFRFRPFQKFSEIEADLSQADIAFFTANQLEKFPASYFDVFINISSLHEMRPEQISLFLAHMARTTRRLIYLKEYASYHNPYDDITIERSHYVLPTGWDVALERPDILNPDFFELFARRSTESPSRPGSETSIHPLSPSGRK